jgi:hypothetical protein
MPAKSAAARPPPDYYLTLKRIYPGTVPFRRFPLEAVRDIASQIPVVEGGPAKRGEPHELVPGGPGS